MRDDAQHSDPVGAQDCRADEQTDFEEKIRGALGAVVVPKSLIDACNTIARSAPDEASNTLHREVQNLATDTANIPIDKAMRCISMAARHAGLGEGEVAEAFRRAPKAERRAGVQKQVNSSAPPLGGWNPNAPWLRNKDGTIRAVFANAATALRHASKWKGVLVFDEFAMQVLAKLPPPFGREAGHNSWTSRPWSDNDDRLTAEWLQQEGIFVSIEIAAQAVQTVATEASFHPVRDFLGALKWDGVERCSGFASAYFEAEDTPYHRAVSKAFLIAAVARIMTPGCQVDCMPVFEGRQGMQKSSGLRVMFDPWFSDDLSELGSKDSKMEMQGVWCLEVAELASMTRGERETVKAFISRREDRFRPSYGRRVITASRQAVLAGTTNDDVYLRDETGDRRFWPIKCGQQVDLEALKRDRDQLWAEAAHLFEKGEPWWLTDPAIEIAAKDVQSSRRQRDPWEEPISQVLEDMETNARDGPPAISVGEILTILGIDEANRKPADEKRVVSCLKALGWSYGYQGPRPGRRRMYVKRDMA